MEFHVWSFFGLLLLCCQFWDVFEIGEEVITIVFATECDGFEVLDEEDFLILRCSISFQTS
jgi:hypothetical protein